MRKLLFATSFVALSLVTLAAQRPADAPKTAHAPVCRNARRFMTMAWAAGPPANLMFAFAPFRPNPFPR